MDDFSLWFYIAEGVMASVVGVFFGFQQAAWKLQEDMQVAV